MGKIRFGILNDAFVNKASIKLVEFAEFAILLLNIMAQTASAILDIMAIGIAVINAMLHVANVMDLKQISV